MRLSSAALNILEYPLRFLFGDDIFVSYSRADGITYAEGLASELAKRKFSCRVDLWETVPGAELPWSLKRALRWSKMLVLVGTSRAIESPHVGFEIKEFLTTSGIVIPIGFGNAIQDATWFPEIRGLPITSETEPTALMTGKPSLAVLSRIENSVKFRRRNRRIRDLSAVAFVVLVLLIALSLYAGWDAARALKQAAFQETAARQATEKAEKQTRLADSATQDRIRSEERAKDASEKEQMARRSAREQQHRAELARKTADLEEQGTVALRQFQSGTGELEALESAVLAGRALLPLVRPNAPFAEYPTITPIMTLNTILTNIHEKSRFSPGGFGSKLLTLSHDGRKLALVRSDDHFVNGLGSLWVWDVEGRPLWHCRIGETDADSLDFVRTSNGVILARQGRGAEFWDSSCKPTPAKAGYPISIDRRHGLFAETDENDSIRITNSAGASMATVNAGRHHIQDIRADPSGNLILASAYGGRVIEAWHDARWVTFFDSGGQNIQDFEFTGDGRYVVVELHGGSIQVLSLAGEDVAHWNTPDSDHRLWMSPVGSRLATVGGGVVRIWDASGELQAQFAVQKRVSDVRFTDDGSRLAVIEFDTVRFVNTKGEFLFQLAGHVGAIQNFFPLPREGRAITTGVDGTVRLWDVANRPSHELVGTAHRIQELAFLPDRNAILTIAQDGTVTLWDESGKKRSQWAARDRTDRAKVSPDGKKIALIYDSRVEIRDPDGHIISTGSPPAGAIAVLQAAFSPDGETLALSRAGGSIQIHNLTTGQSVAQRADGWIYGLAFDATGTKVAGTIRRSVFFFDRAGNRLGQVDTGEELLDVSFSSNGRYMATAGADGAVGLWTPAGRLVQKIFGHSARVLTVCFSPDNQLIATASEDQAVRVWDIKGRQVAVFPARVSALTGEVSGGGFIGPPLKFSPDGRWLALGSDDGVVRIWPLERLSALIDLSLGWLADYHSSIARDLE